VARRPSRRTFAARRALAVAALCLIAVVGFLALRGGGSDPAPTHGAETETLEIESNAVGQMLDTSLVVPAGGGEDRPLLVFLHGRGNDEDSYLEYESLFTALEDLGERAPVIAFPYGGEGSYWHDRDDGDWGTYVLREVIPTALEESGADRGRIAIGGISMGGYGALHLAAASPERFCAAGGHSPALWEEAGLSAPGAFDDAGDFDANDVIDAAATGAYGDLPLWIDAGDEDPFIPGDQAMAAALEAADADVTYSTSPGGHDGDYWEAHFPQYLRFYAGELADC